MLSFQRLSTPQFSVIFPASTWLVPVALSLESAEDFHPRTSWPSSTLWRSTLEMCGNGFQHSHSLPFPFPIFWLIPIPIGFPCGLFPFPLIPILSMLKLYIISDTVIIIICSCMITEILIIYYHYTKNVRIPVQLQTSESGRWYI